METRVDTDRLTYDVSGRVIRGGVRRFKTKEEKENEILKAEMATERQAQTRATIEQKFLTPSAKNFVETPEVNEHLKTVQLWAEAGYPVHVVGPTGCGKTTLALAVAAKFDQAAIWLNGDARMTTSDLVGNYTSYFEEQYYDNYVHNVLKSRKSVQPSWVDNPLTLACKYGYTFIYNEFSRTRAETNNVLLSVLEEGVLEIPTKSGEERYVEVHPNFKAILTSNSIEYAGVFQPQDALLDRMVTIHMDFYDFDTEMEITQAHTSIPADKAQRIVSVVRGVRDTLPEDQKPGTRAAIMIARGLQLLNSTGDETNFEKLCLNVLSSKTKGLEDQLKTHKVIQEIVRETKTAGI